MCHHECLIHVLIIHFCSQCHTIVSRARRAAAPIFLETKHKVCFRFVFCICVVTVDMVGHINLYEATTKKAKKSRHGHLTYSQSFTSMHAGQTPHTPPIRCIAITTHYERRPPLSPTSLIEQCKPMLIHGTEH
jgi:hypothetical protein